MNNKNSYEHKVFIFSLIVILIGVVAFIVSCILRNYYGTSNLWFQSTHCLTWVCIVIAAYGTGYYGGLRYKNVMNK